MWGWGAPDWGTIPAYLQAELQQRRGGPVCVVNFGEQAYVSTQSLIQLELLLESGRVPNVVVFYDGVNEVLAASQNARPFFHQNYEEVAKLFQSPRHPLTTWLGQSSSVYLMRQARSQFGGSSRPHVAFDPDRVADDVAAAYLANLKTVRALAQAYGFEVHFFWQPYILLGDKPLSPEERQMQSGLNWVLNLDQPLRRLFTVTHERIEARAETVDDLHDLVHAFDDVPDPIWIDTWGHITPDGNRLVAQSILRTSESQPRS